MTTLYYPFTLRLREPLTLTRFDGVTPAIATTHVIDGQALRGATSAAIMRAVPEQDRQHLIQELILSRRVSYLPAYPAYLGDERALPAPRNWRCPKKPDTGQGGSQECVYDQASPEDMAGPPPELTVKPLTGPIGRSAGRIYPVTVATTTTHRNLTNRRSGGAGRVVKNERGTSIPTGSVWSQEAIKAGETFSGLIAFTGDEHSIAELAEMLRRTWNDGGLRLGRAGNAGFGGWPEVTWGDPRPREIDDDPIPMSEGELRMLTLTSPAVVRHPRSGSTGPENLAAAVETLTGGALHVDDSYVDGLTLSGMNRHWAATTPTVRAATAGSTVIVKATRDIGVDELLAWEQAGLGERRRDGCGRFVFLEPLEGPVPIGTAPDWSAELSEPVTAPADDSFVWRGQRSALDAMIRRQTVRTARKVAEDVGGRLPSPSVLGRTRSQYATGELAGSSGDEDELAKCVLPGNEWCVRQLVMHPSDSVSLDELQGSGLTRDIFPDGWDQRWVDAERVRRAAEEAAPEWWRVFVAAVLKELHFRAQRQSDGDAEGRGDRDS